MKTIVPAVMPDMDPVVEDKYCKQLLDDAIRLQCNQGEIFTSVGMVFLEPGFSIELLKPLVDHRLSKASAKTDVEVHVRATLGVQAPKGAAAQLLAGIDMLCRKGLLSEHLLKFLWRGTALDAKDYPAAIAMLTRFDMLIELPADEGGETQWIMPMRLALEPPPLVAKLWPAESLDADQTQLGLRFEFLGTRVPAGLTERCLALTIGMGAGKLLVCWRRGLVLAVANDKTKVRIFMQFVIADDGRVTLEMEARGGGELGTLWAALAPLSLALDETLKEFPVDVERSVLCPACRKEGRFASASSFPYATISSNELCEQVGDEIDLLGSVGYDPLHVGHHKEFARVTIGVAKVAMAVMEGSRTITAFAAGPGSHADHSHSADDEANGEFTPMAKAAKVTELLAGLAEGEDHVCKHLTGGVDALRKLLEEVRAAQAGVRDAMCKREGIAYLCRALIEDNKPAALLYDLAFNILIKKEPLDKYNLAAMKLKAKLLNDVPCVQAHTDLASLYEEAAVARPKSRSVMEALSMMAAAHGCQLLAMGPLKRTSRASEKMVLNPDGGGAERVCDVVRDMFVCATMDAVAELLHLICQIPNIELLRLKNRFHEPSGGWRDAMINYRVTGTTHVCELQIAHFKMLMCRKDLGGHEAYALERNARELLEYLRIPVDGPLEPTAATVETVVSAAA